MQTELNEHSNKQEELTDLTPQVLETIERLKKQSSSNQIYNPSLEDFAGQFDNPLIEGLSEKQQLMTFQNFQTVKGSQTDKIKNKLLNEWKFQPVVFTSENTGNGKTHLSIACLKLWLKKWYENYILTNLETVYEDRNDFVYKMFSKLPLMRFVHEREIYYDIQETFNTQQSTRDVVYKYSRVYKFLVIDDLFASRQSEFARSTMYDIVDERIDKWNLPTVVTTNLTLEQISEQIDKRIASRLQTEYCFEIKANDYRGNK